MKILLINIFFVFLFFVIGQTTLSDSLIEKYGINKVEFLKIQALVEYINTMENAVVIRNDIEYTTVEFAKHLKNKFKNFNNLNILSARDFIEKVASYSSNTGKAYLLIEKNKKPAPLEYILLKKLQELELE